MSEWVLNDIIKSEQSQLPVIKENEKRLIDTINSPIRDQNSDANKFFARHLSVDPPVSPHDFDQKVVN